MELKVTDNFIQDYLALCQMHFGDKYEETSVDDILDMYRPNNSGEDFIDSYLRWQEHTQWKSVDGNVAWAGLGLMSEAGEVASLVEKHIRKGQHPEGKMKDELSDVMWNVANLCNLYGIKLSDVLIHNIDKIERRRNTFTAAELELANG